MLCILSGVYVNYISSCFNSLSDWLTMWILSILLAWSTASPLILSFLCPDVCCLSYLFRDSYTAMSMFFNICDSFDAANVFSPLHVTLLSSVMLVMLTSWQMSSFHFLLSIKHPRFIVTFISVFFVGAFPKSVQPV